MHFIPSVSAGSGVFQGQQLDSKAGTSRPHVSACWDAGFAKLRAEGQGSQRERASSGKTCFPAPNSAVVGSPRLCKGREFLIPAGILLHPRQEYTCHGQFAVAWGCTGQTALRLPLCLLSCVHVPIDTRYRIYPPLSWSAPNTFLCSSTSA